jgi:hypothetical protein
MTSGKMQKNIGRKLFIIKLFSLYSKHKITKAKLMSVAESFNSSNQ